MGVALLVAGSGALAADPPPTAASVAVFGFTPEEATTQLGVERRFDADLSPSDLSAWLKNLSSGANHVGSPHDKANAEYTRDLFKQWGWDAQIEVFYPCIRH
jgi:N-acetylated-alpha-linked acidic dipeptidase